MGKNLQIIVISEPGIYRNGLLALLRAIPKVDDVCVIDDINFIAQVPDNFQPQAVIVEEHGTREELLGTIRTIADTWPTSTRIVITDRFSQLKQIETSGVDFLVINNVTAGRLRILIENISDREYLLSGKTAPKIKYVHDLNHYRIYPRQ
jgi:hypothetical protein